MHHVRLHFLDVKYPLRSIDVVSSIRRETPLGLVVMVLELEERRRQICAQMRHVRVHVITSLGEVLDRRVHRLVHPFKVAQRHRELELGHELEQRFARLHLQRGGVDGGLEGLARGVGLVLDLGRLDQPAEVLHELLHIVIQPLSVLLRHDAFGVMPLRFHPSHVMCITLTYHNVDHINATRNQIASVRNR